MPSSKKRTLRELALHVVGAIVFVVARPQLLLFACGATLAIADEALRVGACGRLLKNQAVAQSGPCSHAKNPRYLVPLALAVNGSRLDVDRPW